MTAYKNRKAALAVTAGLVGALTLGGAAVAVPAAYADSAAGAELTSVKPGVTVKANNGYGSPVELKDGNTVTFPAGSSQYLNITDVEGAADYKVKYLEFKSGSYAPIDPVGDKTELTDADAAEWFDQDRGTVTAGRTDNGKKYAVEVTANGATATYYFAYAEQAETYTVYNADDDSTTFTYDGSAVNVEIKNSKGQVVANNNNIIFYDADGKLASGETGDAPVWAGTYTAKMNNGESVSFTIDKLDLSKASVSLPDYSLEDNASDIPANPSDFIAKSGLPAASVKVTKVTNPDKGSVFSRALVGAYTVKFGGNGSAEANASVTGTGSYTYYVLDNKIPGNAQYGTTGAPYVINTSDGQSFDPSKVKFIAGGKTYSGDQIEVTYKLGSKKVEASELTKNGTYTVNVRLKPFTQNDQFVGGTGSFTVSVRAAGINADEGVTFKYDGKIVADTLDASGDVKKAGLVVTYDGSDFLKSVSTEVADSDGKVYEAGKDYKVVVTKDGKEVDKIVDAGEYKVTVEPVTVLDIAGNWTLTVQVDQAQIGSLKDFTNTATVLDAVAYTGSAIEAPQAQYLDGDSYKALDPALYEVSNVRDSSGKAVKEIKDAGTYTVRVNLTDAAAGNYKLADRDFTVQVSKFDTFFQDVAAPEWYAKPVAQAKVNGYVNGISGTQLFAPKADITRADAVCILFNMAGGDSLDGDWEFSYTDGFGYKTGFSDVDGKAYYAKALAWAKASGVANGYGDGTFKPAAQISREEFAALLCNYAKMSGRYTAPSSDALSGVSDAGTVSAWAKDVVNWAVSEKVMGNGGFVAGQARITRAEVAAMGVNFQPETL